MRYAIVIEKADQNYSAYVPDLPGCVATGTSVKEVETEIRDAIRFRLDGLKADGQPVPQPRASRNTLKPESSHQNNEPWPVSAASRAFLGDLGFSAGGSARSALYGPRNTRAALAARLTAGETS